MTIAPEHYLFSEAPKPMVDAAEKYEKKFRIRFNSITYFSKQMLDELHKAENNPEEVPDNIVVASKTDKSIIDEVNLMTSIVNSSEISTEQRKRYMLALQNVYEHLPDQPDALVNDIRTLCVGPEREGRMLGEMMGWLPKGRSIAPDAKRVPYEGGLLVGLSALPELKHQDYTRCVIIDGAIASGSTIMAIMEKLRVLTTEYHIYSVHGPYEGLRALSRYGELTGLKIKLTVGHATAGLNKKFYATVPSDGNALVVGDLGDTISDLFIHGKTKE